MKLYRYRPLTSVLFKELLYREIYLASPEELNDPLDLSGQLDFFTDREDKVRALARFLCKRMLVLHLSRNDYELNLTNRTLDLLRHPDDLGCFILDQFSIGSRTVIDQSDLHEILSEYLDDRARIEKRMARFLATELFSDLNESFAQFLGNSSAVCFAKSATNFLMWSHYASGHAGVCLEFEVDVEDASSGVGRFPLVSPWLNDGKRFAWKENVKAVRYTNSLARASFYDLLAVFDNEGDVDLMNLSKSHWRSLQTASSHCSCRSWSLGTKKRSGGSCTSVSGKSLRSAAC